MKSESYMKLEDIPVFSQEQYEDVVKKYPVLGQLYAALNEFHNIMFSQKPEKLGKWLENMEKMDIPEISLFMEGTISMHSFGLFKNETMLFQKNYSKQP